MTTDEAHDLYEIGGAVSYNEEEKCLGLLLDSWPPPANHAYVNVPGKGRALGAKGIEWKQGALRAWGIHPRFRSRVSCFRTLAGDRECDRDAIFLVEVLCHGPYASFFKEDGTCHKWDIDGRLKLAQDVVFEAIGVDDSRVFDVRGIKCPYPKNSDETRKMLEVRVYLASYVDPQEEE